MRKNIVLVFVDYYLPGHKAGGPIRTIENMVNAMGDDFVFKIVTRDRDLLDSRPYEGVDLNQWNPCGKSSVFYISKSGANIIKNILKTEKYDWIYLNSVFSFKFTILPLILIGFLVRDSYKVMIAPRGELSEGALSIKNKKKMLFLKLANILKLFSNVCWHASSAEELLTIKNAFPDAKNLSVARDLPDCSVLGAVPNSLNFSNELRIIFLSRISPKKNLGFALKVLSKVRVPVLFDIWGTEEDIDYWNMCRSLFGELPSNVTVAFRGSASHEDVPSIMGMYDLFFFPTLGENYGHVIAEAVSVGTPVLISDRTPWRDLINHNAGWDISLEDGMAPFIDAIERAYVKTRDVSEMNAWRRDVYAYAKYFLLDPDVIDGNKRLFAYEKIDASSEL